MFSDGILAVSYGALWLVVIAQALVIIEMLRQIGILRQGMARETEPPSKSGGLRPGTRAPALTGVDIRTGNRINDTLVGDRAAVILFLTPDCSGCEVLGPDLRRFAQTHEERLKVLVVCSSEPESCAQYAERHALDLPILADRERRISQAYNSVTTPSATVIDAEGSIRAYGVVTALRQLELLVLEVPAPARASANSAHGITPIAVGAE